MLAVKNGVEKRGIGFWPSLAAGCALTMVLYAAMIWAAPKFGVKL